MKKIIAFVVFSFFFSHISFAQNDTDANKPAYIRFPTVPPFKILLTDSTTWFSKESLPKKRAILFMLFNPECSHCQHETEELLKNIDKFDDIEIVMSTNMPFAKMKEFYQHYQLDRFKNIIVGQDVNFVLPSFFRIRNLPFLGFYNKKQELISVFEGAMPIDKVLEEFQK
ncbi:MAG: thioredoxin [Bacteroidetes bacterium]|nr:thioredoxin [Bacteroidota bacterium]